MTNPEPKSTSDNAVCHNIRTGTGAAELAQAILDNLSFVQGRVPANASRNLVLADFRAYFDAQTLAGQAWQDDERWTRMSILATARMGKFTSDRSSREYCAQTWNVMPGSDI